MKWRVLITPRSSFSPQTSGNRREIPDTRRVVRQREATRLQAVCGWTPPPPSACHAEGRGFESLQPLHSLGSTVPSPVFCPCVGLPGSGSSPFSVPSPQRGRQASSRAPWMPPYALASSRCGGNAGRLLPRPEGCRACRRLHRVLVRQAGCKDRPLHRGVPERPASRGAATGLSDLLADRWRATRAARPVRELREKNWIAAHIRERRYELDLTQRDVAEQAGTSHSFISKLETGDHIPTIPVLKRILAVLEEELLIGIERRVPDEEFEREVAPVPELARA
jgi:DNA-binding XRE family transcriptional regulator